ncbi:peptidase associated/transthyretin-like domain-containing protein [Occallatibacter riparius]|uniref:Carboxypeptidase regulatory-like domain-containing protein n=1 Tax=Occallatibacter riparius TaxID=1002689 RepID=A0A9J7BNE8_9BACT|nr:carboxypeptidase regulatory-like domain-containing protein [Occallatibacter riparius]UWZ84243.1 carboxypeptidase regulatory-like domain-containing protein [Occallatibacter riparius]
MSGKTILFFFCSALLAATITAQQKHTSKPEGTGIVSGRVFCANTNTPARKASVVLVPADAVDGLGSDGNKGIDFGGNAVETLLDGSFTIPKVAPGVYYVMASAPGYISPLAPLFVPTAEPTNQNAGKKPVISAPRITVQANLPSTVTVGIDRGAAVSGTVLYDDGSPASDVDLQLLVRSKGKWISIPQIPGERASHIGSTDDQGHYRIAGLPPGEYVLDAELTLSTTTFTTDAQGRYVAMSNHIYVADVYSGGTTRTKDAVPFKLTAGDERPGEDIYIPLSKLHTVRGSLIAARDGHLLNGGKVSLLYTDDHSVAYDTNLSKDEETFTLNYVLEGDYILRVDAVSDVEYREVPVPGGFQPTRIESRTVHTYGAIEQPLHVAGEISDAVISVPEQSAQKTGLAQ